MAQRRARMELLERPQFWAAHLWSIMRGPLANGDSRNFDEGFGISADAIEDFYIRELRDEKCWPYYRITVRSGVAVEVEYSNFPEDYQITYRLCNEAWPGPICVGIGGGCWQLPGFRWPELVLMSRAVQEHNPRAGNQLLFLLLPATWIAVTDDLEQVACLLSSAWKSLHITAEEDPAPLIQQLVVCNQSDVEWSRDEEMGWICDGKNSRRNPSGRACLEAQDFHEIDGFFTRLKS